MIPPILVVDTGEVGLKVLILPMLVILWKEIFASQTDTVTQIATIIIGLTITFEEPFSLKTAEIILSITWQIQVILILQDIVDNNFNAIEVQHWHAEQKTCDLKIE